MNQSSIASETATLSMQENELTASVVPNHLIPIAHSSWGLWSWVGLRGAGFPLSRLAEFAAPDLAATAQQVASLEEQLELARQAAIISLRKYKQAIAYEQRLPYKKAIHAILAKRLPQFATVPAELQASLKTLFEIDTQLAATWERFQQDFMAESLRISKALQQAASEPRFREAILWQNREALHSGIEQFIAAPLGQNTAKYRSHRELVAKYFQRYCAKNDSIGFFGPVGWAQWVISPINQSQSDKHQTAALHIQPGADLLAKREVFFETWTIDALSETLSQNRNLARWAVPKLMPFLYLENQNLHLPLTTTIALLPAQAAVLQACDGQRTAQTIATELTTETTLFTNEDEVYTVLEQLHSAHRILWSFEVSMNDWRPEQSLRRQLQAIDDTDARTIAQGALDRLEAARLVVAQASGNAAALEGALAELDATFTELTEMKSHREAGKTYAARTLVYEDCRRDVEVTLGPELLRSLEGPLTLLLTSARWFTHKIAELYRQAFLETYRELAQKAGTAQVDFVSFWPSIHPLLFDSATSLTNLLMPAFQKRWAKIFALTPETLRQHHLQFTSESIHADVERLFSAPQAGWQLARYSSPDVMIAARGKEAIEQDDYYYVLGEFHMGINTLDSIALVAQHPQPADLFSLAAADFTAARIVPVIPREVFSARRIHATLHQKTDYRFIYSAESYSAPQEHTLRSGDLLVEAQGDTLTVRTRNGAHRFDVIEFFGEFLSLQVCDHFKLFAPVEHLPRISLNRMVINRECWNFSPAAMPFLGEREPAKLFAAVQRWAASYEIPRFVFYRSPLERKPYYLDIASPVYVEIFARLVRQLQEHGSAESQMTITEMLPTPDENWLIDAKNRQYTSELRLVIVDATPTTSI